MSDETTAKGTAVTRAVPRTLDVVQMSFSDMLAMGNALVTTGFLPEHIRTGAQAAAIIMTGRELGMQPMRAIRSLQMVKGKVVENADSQLARFKSDGGRSTFRELHAKKAVLWLRHPNGDEHTETFTYADAEAAGLTLPSRNGEKSMYDKFGVSMMRSRAITNGLKSIGWEGGAGNYDPEELPETQSRSAPAAHEPTPTGVNNDTGEVLYDTASEPEIADAEIFNADGTPIENAVAPPKSSSNSAAFNPDESLRFGKYKGRTYRDIATDDLQYLGWLYKQEKEKTKTNAQYAKPVEWVVAFKAFLKSNVPAKTDPASATPEAHSGHDSAEPDGRDESAASSDFTEDDLPF